ncbi:NAD-dependent epimerase/dehydratase family protein [Stackebrandtia nassauensis]|uniref:NAD-dependent epimerase/dehydratase n=1 Tax=Stackebrandtia nassauensis (strain DSM 44728 / CIP 108903 / NRRL B-16338 / NBRC 102104 / LLR-40K-21) TaxID=446470 RepID=D3PY67_STANL|nr:NAD-dependent epimerase/dehydratase family protein [Stackebrandtia nassauensis]ADD45396.1 NAD-dependent epimerase/dehydratase [Stackebrandtia nassauensis DSM 44728]
MTPTTVLVTGADRYLAGRLVARLTADERVKRVFGIDTDSLDGNGDLSRILTEERVDTVVHAAVAASAVRAGGRTAQKESNVLGTMHLLAACQRAESVRRVVVKSSVAAYGASARDPAVFTEDTELRAAPRGEFASDVAEVEAYARGFARRRENASVTVLRLAPLLGPTSDTSLTRYFSLPVVPTVLGYDPRVQFLHIEDALDVLHKVTLDDHRAPRGRPDVYNVAGPGALLLSQSIRRAGRVAAPTPELLLRGFAAVAKGRGLVDFSLDQLDFLKFGRVVDCGHLTQTYRITPRPTSEAFDDFVTGHALMSVLGGESITGASARDKRSDSGR